MEKHWQGGTPPPGGPTRPARGRESRPAPGSAGRELARGGERSAADRTSRGGPPYFRPAGRYQTGEVQARCCATRGTSTGLTTGPGTMLQQTPNVVCGGWPVENGPGGGFWVEYFASRL